MISIFLRIIINDQSFKFILLLLVLLLTLFNFNCYNISNLQNASLLPQNNYEIMASYSLVPYYEFTSRKQKVVSNNAGINCAYGVFDNLNIRFSYEYIISEYKTTAPIHFISSGVKVPIIKNRIAAYLPFGMYFGQESKDYNIIFAQPSLIASLVINNNLNANFSLSEIYFFNNIYTLTVFTCGIEILKLTHQLAVCPEYGFGINPFFNGCYYSFNLGISFTSKK